MINNVLFCKYYYQQDPIHNNKYSFISGCGTRVIHILGKSSALTQNQLEEIVTTYEIRDVTFTFVPPVV